MGHAKDWCAQHWWSDLLVSTRVPCVEQNQPSRKQAILRCHSPHFNLWLTVIPHPGLGFLFTSREFATLLKWKLGLPLGMPPGSKCSRCQHILDPFGDHLVRCSNNGLYKRHNELRSFLQNLFRQAGFTTRREVSVEGGLRPADLLIEDWDGKPLALDISYRQVGVRTQRSKLYHKGRRKKWLSTINFAPHGAGNPARLWCPHLACKIINTHCKADRKSPRVLGG